MYTRTIICLANSRKPPSGRCIAGKELGGARAGQWLRPVSARQSREVSEEERRYETGEKAQLLDIVTVPLNSHSPLGHQTENHILADDYYWTKVGTSTLDQVNAQIDPYDANFWVHAESTYHGLNDKVSEQTAAGITSSLKLIATTNLKIRVLKEGGFEGRPSRKRVRAEFGYHNQTYILSLTDPEIEDHYLKQAEGVYPIGNVTLCISLVEPWNGYAFRVVASVITPDRFGG
jgi:hypothetical protein